MILDTFKRLFGMGRPPGDISCQEALSRVYEFMDGELEVESADQVEEHFRVCTRCYPHLTLEQEFRSRLREALREPDVPPELRTRVLDVLEAEDEAGDPD